MPRPKGLPKSGGRKAGTPNITTRELFDFFEQANFSIPDKILELLPTLTPDKQADVLLKVMEFLYPKRKAIEGGEKPFALSAILADLSE